MIASITSPLTLNPIIASFNRIVTNYAENIAISGQTSRLTYYQTERLALKCAAAINQIQLDQSPVIVCLPRDEARIFAVFLGIIKTGKSYFYIDPATALPIKATLIAKINSKLIIGEQPMPSMMKHLDLEAIESMDIIKLNLDINKMEICEPCCLVQTSGTTQEARVVAISQQTILHNVYNHQRALAITSCDRLSLLTSPQFSAANSAIYAALLSGASLCPYTVSANGLVEFIEWISHEKISILHLTPSLFRLLAGYISENSLPSIRAIKLGGELVYKADIELFKAKFERHCVLINGLGVSEAAGNVAHYLIDHDTNLSNTTIVPVGYALDGHEIIIVDEKKQPVVKGETGEIIIRSRFLANGYWNDPDKTTVKFHSVNQSLEEKELQTNDLGYFLPDGLLVHLGRKDRVIKRHGFSVDLNLIESTLMSFPDVKNAVTYYTPLHGNHHLLIACVQSFKEQDTSFHIKQQLENNLPSYMIPQLIYFCPDFPLTRSGKIDHRAILDELKYQQKNQAHLKPRNTLELQLSLIWRDILQQEQIGIYDNFFEWGGDSLRAMELIVRLSNDIQIECPISSLLENPTIAQLAESIQYSLANRVALRPQKNIALKASILTLQDCVDSETLSPLIFIPGGAMSEKELLLISGLLPYLSPKRLTYGLRLNLLADNIQLPDNVDAIAQIIAESICVKIQHTMPVLIGECIACVLTMAVAKKLESLGNIPKIVLLNPRHPEALGDQNTQQKTIQVAKFLQLLKTYQPLPYSGPIHIIFAQNRTSPIPDSIAWWQNKTKVNCKYYVISGNDYSYIRINRKKVAEAINAICTD